MIKRTDLLAFNFYKKEKFTGSLSGMRYLIRKGSEEDNDVFEVYVWPGPYNFDSTDDSLKLRKTFPFSVDSLNHIADYLNETYNTNPKEWESHKHIYT